MSAKDAVIELIKKLPEETTVPDIMAELYVRQQIDEGLAELDAGKGIPDAEVDQRLAKWLS